MKKLVIVLAALAFASPAFALSINEIRTDNGGTDTDEYFELLGTPGQSLAGYTYVVIGDGTGSCGTIEAVLDLSPYSIQADGYFAACRNTAPTLSGYDVIGLSALNFENSDNVTHMLVQGFTGTNAQDLDTNNDGVLDITPWSAIVDAVGIIGPNTVDCAAGVEYVYATNTVGPDGTFTPGHVLICDGGWYVGLFELVGGYDSPGVANAACTVGTETQSWGQLKETYR